MKVRNIFVFIVVLLFVIGCSRDQAKEVSIGEQIVRSYYTALDAKDYQMMYGLISEGFKQIEPTAKDYNTFEAYMSKFYDTATGISVERTTVTSAQESEIGVDYVAVIQLKNGEKKELKSSFTVRKKQEGWRLIHPYGQNIDNS